MASLKAQEAPVATSMHGLSGRKVEVEFLRAQDGEARDIFVGVGTYEARIQRGRRVIIPAEAFDVIRQATITDEEEDPEDPTGRRKVWVEKQRFPYNLVREVA